MAGAAIISLFWAASYSAFKRLALKEALLAAVTAAIFSATLWVFLSEWLHVALFYLFPLAIGCGVGAFPLMRSYTKRDERIADGVMDKAEGLFARWAKRLTGG